MQKATTSKRGILNPQAAAMQFALSRHEPCAALQPYVERYWIVRWDLRGRDPFPQETLPHPCVNVVIEAGRSAVHGVGTQRFRTVLQGAGCVVGAKFRPGGFYPFYRRPLTELTDRSIPLPDFFGDAARTLEPEILALSEPSKQIAALEGLLLKMHPVRDATMQRVMTIVQQMLDDRSMCTVEQLATRVRCSERTLQRWFHRYVGVSPKWVLRRFRIHEAAERVAAGGALDATALAMELGYFDQAHFSKDFRSQVGMSPSEYAQFCRLQLAEAHRSRADAAE